MEKTRLRVVNLKTGHAVNSSSSHSIIIVKNPNSVEAVPTSYSDFGWDQFVLKSKEEKLHYISAMISSQYYGLDQQIKMTLKRLGLVDFTEYDESTVDHQSVTHIPGIEYKENSDYEIDQNVFRNFLDAYLSDNVIVLGGNDNGGDYFDIEGTTISLSDLTMMRNGNTVCFFEKNSGTRVTLCSEEEVKLETPMLLDIKITDYCGITTCGAACYQNSTTNGKHCNMEYFSKIVEFVKKNKVLEISLLPGESANAKFEIDVEKGVRGRSSAECAATEKRGASGGTSSATRPIKRCARMVSPTGDCPMTPLICVLSLGLSIIWPAQWSPGLK
jgi:hypothetical protein